MITGSFELRFLTNKDHIAIMAGHNKWSKVKRAKGALDVKRGRLFSRLSKEISIAVKLGGGNPASNPRLRAAIQTARSQSMPNDNIDRAIKRGNGDFESHVVEEIVYEGYGPGGVALMIEAATDNKNRTVADIRSVMTKNNGSLGVPGCVAYMFHKKGQILLPSAAAEETAVLEIILDAGAEDLTIDDDHYSIITPPDHLYQVGEALRLADIEAESQKFTYIPDVTVMLESEEVTRQVLKLCDALDDVDDVMNVHANFDILAEFSNTLQAA